MSSPESKTTGNLHRRVPGVDTVLKLLEAELLRWGHSQVTGVVRELLDELRQGITAGKQPSLESEAICREVSHRLVDRNAASLKPVFNLTGTVLHTNLGRASLPEEAVAAVCQVAGQPTNLEFDLDGGARGDRESHVEGLICELTGAEAATVVNNNAAAVLLVLNTLAYNREVPVSRGELVEIGGSFRIPEVMQRSNCTLVEVGATNRTHLKDYRAAIGPDTALLMKVHTSNYRVEGFTKSVAEQELAALSHEHDLPFVVDLGSGSLVDFAALGLPDEPTAASIIEKGADIITFSGDKLLGGPQSGLIAGRRDLVEQIKRNPLKRALRLDKMTLAAIAEVLRLYRDPQSLVQKLPTLRQLTRSAAEVAEQARRLCPVLQAALGDRYRVEAATCQSQIGSGALPIETIPGTALRIVPQRDEDEVLRALAGRMRQLPRPVIGRLHKGALWLDLRCLEQEQLFVEQLGELGS